MYDPPLEQLESVSSVVSDEAGAAGASGEVLGPGDADEALGPGHPAAGRVLDGAGLRGGPEGLSHQQWQPCDAGGYGQEYYAGEYARDAYGGGGCAEDEGYDRYEAAEIYDDGEGWGNEALRV